MAQRIPVRIRFNDIPESIKLRMGTTASVLVMTGSSAGESRDVELQDVKIKDVESPDTELQDIELQDTEPREGCVKLDEMFV